MWKNRRSNMQEKVKFFLGPWTLLIFSTFSLLFSVFHLQFCNGFSISEFTKGDVQAIGDTGYVLIKAPFPMTSRIHCGAACDQDVHCVMFLFSNSTAPSCALYGIPDFPAASYPIDTSPNGGWQVYSMILDRFGCPHHYIKRINKCVNFYTAEETQGDAVGKCIGQATYLIELRSLHDLQFMANVLSSRPGLAGLNFWIGANRLGADFVWLRDYARVNDDLWGSGQPDGVGGPNEDCVDFMDFALNDVACNTVTRSVICEKRL